MKGTKSKTGHFALAALVIVLSASAAGCGGSAPAAQTQATVPQTTLASASSYAVPGHITAAYVQRVLNALERVNSAAGADIVENQSLTKKAVSELRAIFAPDIFAAQINLWVSDIANGLKGFKHPSGEVVDHLVRVLSANRNCIFASATRDVSAVTLTPPPAHTTYVQLVPVSRVDDPSHANPTPWAFEMLAPSPESGEPADPCVASS